MQRSTRYPLILKLLLGLGGVWLASLIMLLLAPLISAYGHAFGIPLASALAGVMAIAAMLVLFLSMPMSWKWAFGADAIDRWDSLAGRRAYCPRSSCIVHKENSKVHNVARLR